MFYDVLLFFFNIVPLEMINSSKENQFYLFVKIIDLKISKNKNAHQTRSLIYKTVFRLNVFKFWKYNIIITSPLTSFLYKLLILCNYNEVFLRGKTYNFDGNSRSISIESQPSYILKITSTKRFHYSSHYVLPQYEYPHKELFIFK